MSVLAAPPADYNVAASFGPIAFYMGVVKGAPFGARFETTEIKGETTDASSARMARGAVYRDSGGLVRREYRVAGGGRPEFDLVIITDYESLAVVVLDVATKVATRFPRLGPGMAHAARLTGWAFGGAWSDEAEAGERTIEGVACRKMRPGAWPQTSVARPEVAGEIWVSDEVRFSILEHVKEANCQHHWRLYDIRRVEPANSLFIVPPDYTQVEVPKLSVTPPKS